MQYTAQALLQKHDIGDFFATQCHGRFQTPNTSCQIGSRLSLYRNGCGFESRELQDIVILDTLSISPVLVASACYADVESLYLI